MFLAHFFLTTDNWVLFARLLFLLLSRAIKDLWIKTLANKLWRAYLAK